MNKKEFMDAFVLPYVKKNDKHYNRQIFADIKGALHKDGHITETQANNWDYPSNKTFE